MVARSSLVGFGDADSFYASAEVVRKPWLAGLPVGVLGNQGACVIARSLPMKRCGVKVGEPIWEAKGKCPDGVYVKRDFRWYEALSRKMLAELGERFSPRVEWYSIDEFFWQGFPEPRTDYPRTAVAVRDHIQAAVGVPMTVAYARTKTLAKLFAETHKPFGAIAVTDRDHERELLSKMPVSEVAGIGHRRAAKMLPYGIRTCLELADAPGPMVRKAFTATVHDLWLELNGEPAGSIRPERTKHKVISRGGSLAGRVRDVFTLYGWLVRNTERLIEELYYHRVRPRELTVYLSYFEDDSAGATVPLSVPTDRFDLLLDAAKAGLSAIWRRGRVATHLHLIASKLVPPSGWTHSLFDPPDPRRDAVARVKREVNDEFGRFVLRSGATLFANDFYDDPANMHDVCDVRGKFCF